MNQQFAISGGFEGYGMFTRAQTQKESNQAGKIV